MHRAMHSLRRIGQRWYQFLRAPMLCLMCPTTTAPLHYHSVAVDLSQLPENSCWRHQQVFPANNYSVPLDRYILIVRVVCWGRTLRNCFWHTISDFLIFKYWSLHAELMLPNNWRSEWYSRLKCNHGFIKKSIFFVHLLFHVATTSANHNRNHNQICIASWTETLNVTGLFRSLGQ